MKLIRAIVRPEKVDGIIDELQLCRFIRPGLSDT